MERWFNPIECDNTVDDPLVTGAHDFLGVDEEDLRIGRPVAAWDGRAWLRSTAAEDDGDPDDVLQVHLHRLPVYSRRLRAALGAAGVTGVQYLPVRVLRSDGSPAAPDGDFAIANVLTAVAALDLDRSVYGRYGDDRPDRKGEIRHVWRPVLRREAVAGHDFIRLAEFDVYLCVSGRFEDAFRRGRFTGYSFEELAVV